MCRVAIACNLALTYVLAVYILGHFFAVGKQTFYWYLSIISVPDPDPVIFSDPDSCWVRKTPDPDLCAPCAMNC